MVALVAYASAEIGRKDMYGAKGIRKTMISAGPKRQKAALHK